MDIETRKKIIFDVVFLLSVFLVLFTALAIYSYSPEDPSYTHIVFSDYDEQVSNLFGKTGAYIADLFGVLFGWVALLVPALLAVAMYRIYRLRMRRMHRWYTPAVLLLLSILAICLLSMFSGFLGDNDFYFAGKPLGGVIGLASSAFLTSVLGRFGGALVALFLLAVCCLMLFSVTLQQAWENFVTAVITVRLWIIKGLRRTLSGMKTLMQMLTPSGRKNREMVEIKPNTPRRMPEPEVEPEPVFEHEDDDFGIDLADEVVPDESDEPAVPAPASQVAPRTIRETETVRTAKRRMQKYSVPLSLLDEPPSNVKPMPPEKLQARANMLEEKLADFGVLGRVADIQPGPVVTMFEFEPAPGIKVSKIAGLSDDLALAMSATSVRIIAPIPGKPVVGIELPNEERATVGFVEILRSEDFVNTESALPFAMGKKISGTGYVSDLAKMPHLLVAGATGAGKSVAVNALICSILFKSPPEKVKFVMIDPKMVELSMYDGIPHLAAPVVIDPRQAAAVLRNVVSEMEGRYQRLTEHRVRNIISYNDAARKDASMEAMPYLVVVVDEFADLMMVAGKEVEQSIIRIAQMARAVGIHLVLATQRPSVNVITGIIKANMPARLSFRVASKIDSRTILDANGAEQLLGMGDSLFMPPGAGDLLRIHGCFVSEDEVNRVVSHLKTLGEPEYNMELVKDDSDGFDEFDDDDVDDKFIEALELVRKKGFASISMIQRYLRIGYNRAARIVEIMEQRGIVAPSDGTSKPRELLKKD